MINTGTIEQLNQSAAILFAARQFEIEAARPFAKQARGLPTTADVALVANLTQPV